MAARLHAAERGDAAMVAALSEGDAFDLAVEAEGVSCEGSIEPRLVEAHRVLTPRGSLYFHIDYREVHYCRVLLDGIFGSDCFLNEIIWAYDYGGRPRRRWPAPSRA